jgi:hypothetical protein
MAMIATETPAAISRYSMAVAPDSSFTKRTTTLFTGSSSSLVIPTGAKVRTEDVVLFKCICPTFIKTGQPDRGVEVTISLKTVQVIENPY